MNQFTTILLCLVCIGGTATAQQAAGPAVPEKETPAIFSLPRFHAQVIQTEQDALLFQVQVNNPERKLVRVTIEGNELMPYEYDCSSAKNYLKSFNFCNMDDGVYKVKITCGSEKVVRKIRLVTHIDVRRTTTLE
jgi:hypothetical protein